MEPTLGLDADETCTVLTDRRYRPRVAADQAAAVRLGVRGVPAMLIDGRIALSGVQPIEVLLDALRQAWSHTGHTLEGSGVGS